MRKPTASVEVRSARIEFGDGDVRVGEALRLRATTRFETDSIVSCIVPGHDRPGTELINDEVVVGEAPFEFELHGTCAFTREFRLLRRGRFPSHAVLAQFLIDVDRSQVRGGHTM